MTSMKALQVMQMELIKATLRACSCMSPQNRILMAAWNAAVIDAQAVNQVRFLTEQIAWGETLTRFEKWNTPKNNDVYFELTSDEQKRMQQLVFDMQDQAFRRLLA